jgi:hypothetical protein
MQEQPIASIPGLTSREVEIINELVLELRAITMIHKMNQLRAKRRIKGAIVTTGRTIKPESA